MRLISKLALSVCVSLAAASTALAGVQVSIRDGRVSIVAKDATVGQILTEWARVGQTKVVNLEVIPGDRVTIELTDVSEQEALRIVLRHVSGYMAARRAIAVPDASVFDRILVMPPSIVRALPSPVASASATPAEAAGAQANPFGLPQPADAGANAVNDEPPPPPVVGEIPAENAQAQASFKARQSLEVADPRLFNFPRPQPALVQPGAPRGPGGQ